jgi:hypothetical protein
MHLRHLIVLIINARNFPLRALVREALSSGKNEMTTSFNAVVFDRSDQINQNSRGVIISPRGAGQTK